MAAGDKGSSGARSADLDVGKGVVCTMIPGFESGVNYRNFCLCVSSRDISLDQIKGEQSEGISGKGEC